MTPFWFLGLVLLQREALPVRLMPLTPTAAGRPIRIPCPIGARTRIVLPEPMVMLKASPGAGLALGVEAEQARPFGIVSLRPVRRTTGTLEARGPTMVLTLVVEAGPSGTASEVRLTLVPPEVRSGQEPKPAPTPSPTPEAIPEPVPSPEESRPPLPKEEAPSPSPALEFDPAVLITLKPVVVGRTEGMPSQRPLVLDDILESGERAWLRFTLKKGSGEHVQRVWWPLGDITNVTEAVSGADLRIVVEIPRRKAGPKTRVSLAIRGGGSYTFALSDPSFTTFLKRLFW
jgi:hypothetical protein